jgi:hypothetical protein
MRLLRWNSNAAGGFLGRARFRLADNLYSFFFSMVYASMV